MADLARFTPDYAPPPPRSGLARTAMILGIASIPLVCVFGAGLLLAVAALTLGIIAVRQISRTPESAGGKGMAVTGIVTACATLGPVLLVALILPSLGRPRELRSRSYCAANIRGVLQSMVVYASENGDALPVMPPPSTPGAYAIFTTVAPASTADLTLKRMYETSNMNGDVTAPFWILVLQQRATAKQLICRNDGYGGVAAPVNDSSSNFFANLTVGTNDKVDKTLSYSLAYPYSTDATPVVGPWWKNTGEATLPLMSDMAPLHGTGRPAADVTGTTKTANSFNHGRDSQNVGYADVHAQMEKGPRVGQDGDNIFTTSGTPTGTPVSPGRIDVTTFRSSAAPPFGTVMVPVRDLRDGTIR